MLENCPACDRSVEPGSEECPYCGVVFAKWRGRQPMRAPTRAPQHSAAPPPIKVTSQSAGSSGRRLAVLAVLGLVGGLLVAGGYWWWELRPRVERVEGRAGGARPVDRSRLRAREDALSDFDLSFGLGTGPIGLVWNRSELVAGNRETPWGFLRLTRRDDGDFQLEKVEVRESTYDQQVSFNAVTWNGTHYVAYTSGDWFQIRDSNVFTLHDRETLSLMRHVSAPPLIGCLAWDGGGYWAATRRNTRDSGERAYLYRLDDDLRVVQRFDPPALGCQGLVWDGAHLWFADVFSDRLLMLDVSGREPRVVRRHSTRFDYLSGVAFDGSDLWVVEYGEDRLHRLDRQLLLAWKGRSPSSPSAQSSPSARSVVDRGARELERAASSPRAAVVEGADEDEVAELRAKLRSEHWADRLRASSELRSRDLGVDYSREQETPAASPAPDDTGIYDWILEIRDDRLYGSWHLYFGEGLFSDRNRAGGVVSVPLFVRYSVSVEGGTLSQPVEHEYEAEPGDNRRNDVLLASRLGPGRYQAYIFLHVQYVGADGGAKILNRSSIVLEVDR